MAVVAKLAVVVSCIAAVVLMLCNKLSVAALFQFLLRDIV